MRAEIILRAQRVPGVLLRPLKRDVRLHDLRSAVAEASNNHPVGRCSAGDRVGCRSSWNLARLSREGATIDADTWRRCDLVLGHAARSLDLSELFSVPAVRAVLLPSNVVDATLAGTPLHALWTQALS